MVAEENEPFTFLEVINSLNRKEWRDAMQEELNSLNENETWVLVNLPQGRKPIENRWAYKIKKIPDGEIQSYKARLVAKGFYQNPGTDYNETFSPVVRYKQKELFLVLLPAKV
ncbi:Retrovirus-related Pol polyprotein from transposon TNT 1-94 [Araneus ventricosus]|uniref:Retrovirus-related Pol polyprotein from transposon TNT 1-94 n=1 Tax=Araneus ventricosus TaxID=182803 RepID=A0A4Y2BF05_ARAVE|nr:Retrovirus-related Pol polyprotein from transposon TNT 1-94 [Araneus ventricosus]